MVDAERHICDIIHSSKWFLEKYFISLVIFKAIMLTD